MWTAERITPSDVEKVICSGIPINKMGNLKKMSAFHSGKAFQPEAFQQAEDYKYFKPQTPGGAL